MYKVPTGYNITTSVYALDADLKLSQDQPQVSHEQPPGAISSGTNSATAVATTSAAADPNSETPVANRGTPVATPVGDLVATPTANPVATTTLKKTVPTGATDDLPQSNVIMNPWTPGVVRYAAMQLVAQNWERLAVHVECAGDTPIAKLAQFKRGMSKHGVTEVHSDQPHCLYIFFFL